MMERAFPRHPPSIEGARSSALLTTPSQRRSFGFDLLSIAPQRHSHMDDLELSLPELPVADPAATGQVSDRIPERFARFFRELQERPDDGDRRGLYSVDRVVATDRFPSPIPAYGPMPSPQAPRMPMSISLHGARITNSRTGRMWSVPLPCS